MFGLFFDSFIFLVFLSCIATPVILGGMDDWVAYSRDGWGVFGVFSPPGQQRIPESIINTKS